MDGQKCFVLIVSKYTFFVYFGFQRGGGGGVERGVTSILIDKGKVMTKVKERESSAKNTSPDWVGLHKIVTEYFSVVFIFK